MKFKLISHMNPAGGQPEAIRKLVDGYKKHGKQTLLGITGSGKTFVMAQVIAAVQKPTLVLAHNKTLAAQLYTEFKEFFPENRVEYFISYFDYYQPESYMPTTDTYIEKESTVNKEIEKMRLKTMAALLSREDVIVVASISCIYGAGNPFDFKQMALKIKVGEKVNREVLIERLVAMQYMRNDEILESGRFRVRGDVIDVFLAYDKSIIRIELFGDSIEKISELHAVTLEKIATLDAINLFPAKQFVAPESKMKEAKLAILAELEEHAPTLGMLESERIRKRVTYDLEMIDEVGYCSGIENYSRHLDGRTAGSAPYCLLDYFPDDFLMIIDESHRTIPQAQGMYKGDYSRKKNLVEYGFRLPSAFDNRPLKFGEFEKYLKHVVFVSATPARYEMQGSGQVVELIIRPTGLVDPLIEVKPIDGQIADLLLEIAGVVRCGERVFVTTLTKKMAEDLTEYLAGQGVKVRYMHSEIESLDRIELLRALRAGEYDVLVGINLLREGLDVPEVSLVAILDADKEGFLRDESSLIQTIGRAARNVRGRVVMYANKMTESMRRAIGVTKARREAQIRYNTERGIVPQTILKSVVAKQREIKGSKHMAQGDIMKRMVEVEAEMRKMAEQLDFEKAIELRDYLEELKREI